MTSNQKAILAGGCFWGLQDLIRNQARCGLHAGGLQRREHPQRNLP